MSSKRNKLNPYSRRALIIGRFTFITVLVLLVAAAIVGMMIHTTVAHRDEWVSKGDSTLRGTKKIPPMRGEILADDGSILATNLHYYNLRIDFRASRFNILQYDKSVDSLADSLAAYYPQRDAKGWRRYMRSQLNRHVSKRSRSFLVLRNLPYNEVERVRSFPFFNHSRNRQRTGLRAEPVLRRRYPYGDMARLSIGRVGEQPDTTVRGVSGLEYALDSLLYGAPGLAEKVLVTHGTDYWPVVEPRNGYNVITTINITMQDILESELGEMLVHCNADWGTAMIMEVATGDIKAISNLERDTVDHPGTYIEAKNRIVEGVEPGSVTKIMSMLVALEEGWADLDRVYYIEPKGVGYRYAGGKPIRDTHSPSSLPVSRFIEYSSNIGMTKLVAPHYEHNLNGLRERLRQTGFFDRFHTGIANERPPLWRDLEVKNGGRITLSRYIYGYGMHVPPLYTCAFYNAIVNDGRFVRPRLVKALSLPGVIDSVIPVSYVRDEPICSPRNAQILRQMMHDVVWQPGGTAKRLRNDIVEIAGKTGTAGIAKERPKQKYDANGRPLPMPPFVPGYVEGKHNRVTFCGFFPYENPKYTCIVVISDPQGPYGAEQTCGYVLRNVALKLYSRGMLGNTSDYRAETPTPSDPTLYATADDSRSSRVKKYIGTDGRSIGTPHAAAAGTVPDVRGLGIREALVRLEEAGLNVHFTGTGYVTSIHPAAGTPVTPGANVTVHLGQE